MAQLQKEKKHGGFAKRAMRLIESTKWSMKRMHLSEEKRAELDDKLIRIISEPKTDIEDVRRLIRAGADIAATNDDKNTTLHLAAFHGKKDVCALLLHEYSMIFGDVKALIGMRSRNISTALHLAASTGYAEICALLISEYAKAGGNKRDLIMAKNSMNRTALHNAAQLADPTTCELLLRECGKENLAELIDAKEIYGKTALMLAMSPGSAKKTARVLAGAMVCALVGTEPGKQVVSLFRECISQ